MKSVIHKIPVKQEYPALCALNLVKMSKMRFAKTKIFKDTEKIKLSTVDQARFNLVKMSIEICKN